ncbi:Lnb N-terminal periplasmic domain-containing protein [Desulfogranum japonicum]|uniref:Lnb N-terminal periplasmic domain-containing protein n=1 Tax=Desulfogranum japonicum TaxID=231447 RepID=UPI0003F8CA16|nr:DUF4105 domain-containing protein [Desulfogranum japonicum]
MKNLLACILLAVFLFWQPDSSLAVYDISALKKRAHDKHIWASAKWLKLLHYIDNTSLIPFSANFFFSKGASLNPETEGYANLEMFWGENRFATETTSLADTDPRCRFPARYSFLAQELDVVDPEDVIRKCPALSKWLTAINGTGLSLVLPVSYMNNPASMFGHTLLRIDSADFSSSDPLLSASVGFVADAGAERGIGYAAKGLVGNYLGYFSATPYYVQAQMYGSLEDRDIWEYPLDLTQQEIDFFLLHVWELQGIGIPYYFLRQNCAYQLLALLEVLRPELPLINAYQYWTLPVETVRQIEKKIGLRAPPVYRPSKSSRILQAAQRLSQPLQQLGANLGQNSENLKCQQFTQLNTHMQACVLELAMLYNQYLQVKQHPRHKVAGETKLARVQHELAIQRSTLPRCKVQQPHKPLPVRPDKGHPSMRIVMGAGVQDGLSSWLLGGRPILHDVFDPLQGYIPGVGIEILDTEFRYTPSTKQLKLESLDLITLQSTNPLEPLWGQPAWLVNLGFTRFTFADDDDSLVLYGQAGIGRTTPVTPLGYGYGLGGISLWVSDKISGKVEAGPTVELGWLFPDTDHWVWGLKSLITQPLILDDQVRYQTAFTVTYRLTPQQALRGEFASDNFVHTSSYSALFEWCFYFD